MVGAVMRMDFCDQKMRQQASISVGDAHHFVKSDVLTRCPSGSPMADLLKILRKGIAAFPHSINIVKFFEIIKMMSQNQSLAKPKIELKTELKLIEN